METGVKPRYARLFQCIEFYLSATAICAENAKNPVFATVSGPSDSATTPFLHQLSWNLGVTILKTRSNYEG